jgi:hypothetical protein
LKSTGDILALFAEHERQVKHRLPRERAAALLGLTDCGAHGCISVTKPTGMRTNGGCRCLIERNGERLLPTERQALRAALTAAVELLAQDIP